MSAPTTSATPLAFDLPGRGRALFTTRVEGNMSSLSGDGAQHAHATRERLRKRIGVEQLVRGYQVHGTVVRRVRTLAPVQGETDERPRSDGQATALAGVGAMVLAADCLPVALGCDGAVAMLHAGWRGLAAGVLEAGVLALRELAGASISDDDASPQGEQSIDAIVGPGAGVCCYEVGAEVHEAFKAAGQRHVPPGTPGTDGGARNIDLRAIAHQRLLAAGVERVRDVDVCTICDERFFSHRREGARAGRQAGVAWLS